MKAFTREHHKQEWNIILGSMACVALMLNVRGLAFTLMGASVGIGVFRSKVEIELAMQQAAEKPQVSTVQVAPPTPLPTPPPIPPQPISRVEPAPRVSAADVAKAVAVQEGELPKPRIIARKPAQALPTGDFSDW